MIEPMIERLRGSERIAKLNDDLRIDGCGGMRYVTRGVRAKGADFELCAMGAMALFSDFTEGNDPYGEHDFGALNVGGVRLFFKIDYYDLEDMSRASRDPADPTCTQRMLTLMLADEY